MTFDVFFYADSVLNCRENIENCRSLFEGAQMGSGDASSFRQPWRKVENFFDLQGAH